MATALRRWNRQVVMRRGWVEVTNQDATTIVVLCLVSGVWGVHKSWVALSRLSVSMHGFSHGIKHDFFITSSSSKMSPASLILQNINNTVRVDSTFISLVETLGSVSSSSAWGQVWRPSLIWQNRIPYY